MSLQFDVDYIMSQVTVTLSKNLAFHAQGKTSKKLVKPRKIIQMGNVSQFVVLFISFSLNFDLKTKD